MQTGVPRSALAPGVPRTRKQDLGCAPLRLNFSDIFNMNSWVLPVIWESKNLPQCNPGEGVLSAVTGQDLRSFSWLWAVSLLRFLETGWSLIKPKTSSEVVEPMGGVKSRVVGHA